jgi:hypothetical protein
MWPTTKLFYRSYHFSLKMFSSLIPFPQPVLYQGSSALTQLVNAISKKKQDKYYLLPMVY